MSKKPPINAHAGVSSGAVGLGFWPESSISTLIVCEQRRLYAQAYLNVRCSKCDK